VTPRAEWLEDDEAVVESEHDVDFPGFWREAAEPLSPLGEGIVVADRYIVSDVLDVQEDTILYYVRDLWRCWQCGFEGNAPDEAFCAQCGASLDRKPSLRLLEVDDAAAEAPEGETVAARLAHEDRTFLLLAEPERKAPVERKSIRLVVGQRSDAGQVRELDEDSVLSLVMAPTYGSRTGPVLGLFAVADGMGGHEGGEVASKLALQVLADRVIRTILLSELSGEFRLDEDVIVRLRQAMMAANDEVYLARQKRGNDMGTTLTAVLVRDSRLYVAHVGDCRAFRWNADGLEQLTVDHSVIASMVASGQAKPEEIYTHPHRSVIYRCVGDQPTVQVDTEVLRLTPGDRIIICCDGLWEMVRNEGIEDVMLEESEPQTACDVLVRRANLAGGDDNISVIVVQVEGV
jgi:serine/threonine protein phosphatase PrpC